MSQGHTCEMMCFHIFRLMMDSLLPLGGMSSRSGVGASVAKAAGRPGAASGDQASSQHHAAPLCATLFRKLMPFRLSMDLASSQALMVARSGEVCYPRRSVHLCLQFKLEWHDTPSAKGRPSQHDMPGCAADAHLVRPERP